MFLNGIGTQDFTTNDCYTLDYQATCNNGTETFYEQRCVPNEDYCKAHEFTGGDAIRFLKNQRK